MPISLTVDLRTPNGGFFGTDDGGVPGGALVTLKYDRDVRDADGTVPAPAQGSVVVSGTTDPVVSVPFANDDAAVSDDSQGFAIIIGARWRQGTQVVSWSKTVAIDSSYGSAVNLSGLPTAAPVPPQYMTVTGALAAANQAVSDASAAESSAASSASAAAASAALVGAPAGSAIDAHLGGDSTGLVPHVAAVGTPISLYATQPNPLSAAISATPAGGVVLIDANVTVDPATTISKTVTVRGAGGVITKGATAFAASNWINLAAPGIRLENVSVADPSGNIQGVPVVSINSGSDECAVVGGAWSAAAASPIVSVSACAGAQVTDMTITACAMGIQGVGAVKQAKILRNKVSGWKQRAIYLVGVASGSPDDVEIASNSVTGMSPGGTVRYPILVSPYTGVQMTNVKVHHNTVIGPGKSYTAADPGTADQISVSGVNGGDVSYNTSMFGGDEGITIGGTCTNITATGNVAMFNDTSGMNVWVGGKNTTFTGNVCMNNGQNRNGDRSTGSAAGITVNGASNTVVTGNTLGDDQATKTQNYGVRVINSTNTACGPNVDAGNKTSLHFNDTGNTSTNVAVLASPVSGTVTLTPDASLSSATVAATKSGQVVTMAIRFDLTSTTASGVSLGTLPSGYRPSTNLFANAHSYSPVSAAQVQILTTGAVSAFFASGAPQGVVFAATVTYVVP